MQMKTLAAWFAVYTPYALLSIPLDKWAGGAWLSLLAKSLGALFVVIALALLAKALLDAIDAVLRERCECAACIARKRATVRVAPAADPCD